MWRNRLLHRDRDMGATGLNVLSWGPGSTSPHYDQRLTLVDQIRGNNDADDVRMSEELAASGPPTRDALRQEYLDAHDADIIVILLATAPPAYGAELEIVEFRNDLDIRAKTRVLVPEDIDCVDGGLLGNQFLDALAYYASAQTFRYTMISGLLPDAAVQWCIQQVENVRIDKFRRGRQV